MPDDRDKLIGKREAAKLCGIGTSTLDRYRAAGWFPPPVKLGNCLRWKVADLEAWIEQGCPRQR